MPPGKYIRTNKIRREQSERIKNQIKNGSIMPFQKGHQWSEEIRKKISLSQKGRVAWNKGKVGIYSQETLAKMGVSMRGKKHKEETKKRIGNSVKNKFREHGYLSFLSEKGKEILKNNWFKKDHSTFWTEESRKKASFNRSGSKNPSWFGGKSFEPYSIDWTPMLRKEVRERDCYTCQICGNFGKHVHHIDYDKKNCSKSNLITLCIPCHMKTNFNRENWLDYFKNKTHERL